MEMSERKTIVIHNSESICANCKYFIQHYYRFKPYGYWLVNSGHCTKARVKQRSPCDKACAKFESNYAEVNQPKYESHLYEQAR